MVTPIDLGKRIIKYSLLKMTPSHENGLSKPHASMLNIINLSPTI